MSAAAITDWDRRDHTVWRVQIHADYNGQPGLPLGRHVDVDDVHEARRRAESGLDRYSDPAHNGVPGRGYWAVVRGGSLVEVDLEADDGSQVLQLAWRPDRDDPSADALAYRTPAGEIVWKNDAQRTSRADLLVVIDGSGVGGESGGNSSPGAAAPGAAAEQYTELELERARGQLLMQTTEEGDSLQDLIGSWMTTLKSELTRESYYRTLVQHLNYCAIEGLHPFTLRKIHFNGYSHWLARRMYADITVARMISTMSSFYDHLVEMDAREYTPVTKGSRPKVSKQQTDKVLTDSQVAIVFEDARRGTRTIQPLCSELAVKLLIIVGLRVSDVCGLDLRSLTKIRTREGMRAAVRFVGKGGKHNTRDIPEQVLTLLRLYLEERPTPAGPEHADALLLTRSGERINRFQLNRILERPYTAGAVEQKPTPHSGRHTFTYVAGEEGATLKDTQEALGHASVTTTEQYGQTRRKIVADPARLVANYFLGDQT